MVVAFRDDGYLIDAHICDPVVLVPQVKHPAFDVGYLSAKNGGCAACHVDLFSHQMP